MKNWEYIKVGNESIDKQEWSMFSGLKKDAEKEIGNSDTVSEYNAEIQRLTKKAEQLRRMGQGKSAIEVEKQIEKLGKELRELGNKKVGNRESLVGKYVWVRSKGDEWKCYVLQDHGNKLYIQDTDGHLGLVSIERVTGVVKNKKTGNKSIDDEIKELEKDLKTAQHDLNYMKKYRQDTRGTEMRVKELESQHRLLYSMKSRGFNSKTGNSFDAGSRITIRHNGKEEEVKVLKDMPTSILVKGQSGAVVEIKKTDFEVVKANNTKKTGNATGYEKSSDIAVKGRLALIKKWLKDGIGNPDEINKEIKRLEEELKNRGLPVGNEETKAERKFGKVMGEFEEGTLKTPQGKTVTDPAQAKAIAYSEADKVDNLKRARNAMNKKTKNEQITLWKGNDTVLISEDGTVQYLESNSFEVDRDKYDSQKTAIEEMTKQGYRKK